MKRIPTSALYTLLFSLSLLTVADIGMAQDAKTEPKHHGAAPAAQTGKSKTLADGFILLPSGLEYKIMKHGTGKRKPVVSDHIELNISYSIHDSMMFESRKINNNKPVAIPVGKPRGAGDPVEVFSLMVAGDSAVVRYPIDSMKKSGQPTPPWAHEGDKIVYFVSLVSVKTDAEDKKENEEKAAKQTAIDDKILEEYFTKNNIHARKTASGLYYSIVAEGNGETIRKGQKIGVNYTGSFIDGKKFDSNTDSTFHHMQPFTLEVGKGNVIKGWDEGLQLLKIGSKAKLYIPSPLAYGPQDQRNIPGNSILVFEVEILDMPDQAKVDDKIITDYLQKNNIKATKTPSGLYYVITQKGLGENAKAGKKVSMNYTGKTVDGNAFDSNVDPKFNHVTPFQFTLGQGQVIKGWDEGVQLLKLGSKGTLFIPSALAYGERGTGPIPANAVLIFDVEVTGIDN